MQNFDLFSEYTWCHLKLVKTLFYLFWLLLFVFLLLLLWIKENCFTFLFTKFSTRRKRDHFIFLLLSSFLVQLIYIIHITLIRYQHKLLKVLIAASIYTGSSLASILPFWSFVFYLFLIFLQLNHFTIILISLCQNHIFSLIATIASSSFSSALSFVVYTPCFGLLLFQSLSVFCKLRSKPA